MKDIPGYEGLYATFKFGAIWGHRQNKFLKPWLIGHGYETVSLYKDNKQKKFLVHRLIAMNYVPNPFNYPEVNHKNANRLDNNSRNLEWVSSKQNKQHAISLGLYKNLGKNTPKGSKCYCAKLTESKVIKIRKLYSDGGFTHLSLAKRYKVSENTICHIISYRSWKHI